MSDEFNFPPPGLQGDYAGACTVCLNGTDSAVGFRGSVRWLLAGLHLLGITDGSELVMIEDLCVEKYDCERGTAPSGNDLEVVVTVCADCLDRSPFPGPPSLLGEGHEVKAFGEPTLMDLDWDSE